LGTLKFKEMVDITQYEKGGTVDAARFNIDMGEKSYKFKAESSKLGSEWFNSLTEWREYEILH
jgi:hypothetical protein